MDEEDDPFPSLTAICHVTSPQLHLLHRTAAFLRQHERFPSDDSPAEESTVIRMESPPEDEFLTPGEDSLPAVSSGEALAADLGRESGSTVVIEWGREGCLVGDPDGFKVVGRRRVSEVGLGFREGKEVVDLGADEVFDGMSVGGRRVSELGLGFLEGKEVVDLGAEEVFDGMSVRGGEAESVGLGEGNEVVDLGADEVVDGMFVGGREAESVGLDEGVRTGIVDLGADKVFDEMPEVESVGLGEGLRTQVVDLGLDGKEGCGGDLGMGNGEVEKGLDENVSTEVVDLDENETCGDLPMGNGEVEKGLDENVSTAVVDLDENEMCDDPTMRNVIGEIGTKEGGEVCRDEFKGFSEKGIEEIGNRKFVASKNDENRQKNEGVGGWSELYGDLSKKGHGIGKSLNKPRRDENRGFAEKSVEDNDKFQRLGEEKDKFRQKGKSVGGSSKLCDDLPRTNPCRGGIRGFVKGTDFQKGDNIPQKGKGPAEARKLPSSLRMLTDIALGDASHRERNTGFVEKNRHESNKSKSVDGPHELPSSVDGPKKNSTDQTNNDQIMKNLLDALALVTRGERKKVADGSGEKVDFLETAMIRGIVIPRPRWWPPEEGSDDDSV